jgi:magnesium-protoporphyrin IX monomethyl ester (oxidative) cyclase
MLVRPDNRCGWGFMWSPLAINLEYIAATIENDVDKIKIVNQEFDDTPISEHIRNFKPDFFGVTMSATEHYSGLELCKTAKKHGITTAVGGYHPTAIPMDMMKHSQVDMVFKGESEITFKEFIKQGTPEDIPGITYRDNGSMINNPDRPLIEDLDSLPFPARHLRTGNECDHWLNYGLGHRDQVHTSRGCWGKCTFCCEPSMSMSVQRYRDPDNVMKEIKEVYKIHDEEKLHILFGDPHFLGKSDRVERLCDLLISENMDITFTAMVRADSIAKNPEVVKKMVKAGVIGYCMGIESPAQGELNNTKKGISAQMQKDAVRLLRENHAVAGGTFIIGLPGQTEEEIKVFPEYARSLGMINAAFAIVTPQAGTEFYNELDSKGLISDRDWTSYDQMHSVFDHDTLSKDKLEQLLTHCIGRFYAPDIFIDDII